MHLDMGHNKGMTESARFDKPVPMNPSQNVPHSEVLADRKGDHLFLSSKARTSRSTIDGRFNYEPLFFTHPKSSETWPQQFLSHQLDYPLWVSSMTGGTDYAKVINENLARLCGEFKLGMGLGSCRPLLESHERLRDFDVRKYLGNQPLFANIGIAQVEELVLSKTEDKLLELIKILSADGLMIHLNPLQEWFQPEGDRFTQSPLKTLELFLEKAQFPVMVKEVGQGLGPKSLRALLELPIAGIEFGAFGGTNFTLLEQMRGELDVSREAFISVGHTASEMVDTINALPKRNKEFIISGGIQNMLDGFELKTRLKANSLIGMASAFLKPALENYDSLRDYFLKSREALLTARGLLELKEDV
jgi:isopentenyl-diphosphate delta-isomerase